MKKFTFEKQAIEDVVLVTPTVFGDERGFFMEEYTRSEFVEAGITTNFISMNHSKSAKGVLRGLHFQKPPHTQAKLVRCIAGEIFDVAVDLRKKSPTYGQWVSAVLSAENKKMLYIPEGFAHGILTLSDNTEIIYLQGAEYDVASEGGLKWDDPTVAVEWPLNGEPVLSAKDQILPLLENVDFGHYSS